MNWLWPQNRNLRSSPLIRAGRVVHWLFIVLSALGALFGWQVTYVEGDKSIPISLMTGLFIALPFALVGRAGRYILADE